MTFVIVALLIGLGIIFADWRVMRHFKSNPEYVPLYPIAESLKKLEGVDVDVYVDTTMINTENAFTGGIFKKFLVLTAPTLHSTSNDTLQAVLVHEVGHIKKFHPLQRALMMMFAGAAALHIFYYFPYFAAVVLVACLTCRNTILRFINPLIDEFYLYQEYEADDYARRRGYGPELICYLKATPTRIHINRIKRIVEHAEKGI